MNWKQPSTHEGASSPPAPQGLWFAVSLGLVGIIVGFMMGTWRLGATSASGPIAALPSSSVPSAAQPKPTPSGPIPSIDPSVDHIRGSKNAKIAIIEYSDFQCPFCKRVHPTIEQVLKDNPEVSWVYRTYPLSFHPNAEKLAEGAECVAEQRGNDGFWKYADAVFGTMDVNGDAATVEAQIVKTATDLGASAEQFKTCLSSGKYAQKIKSQQDAGAAAGVSGTPGSFVVNLATQKSVSVVGAQPLDQFKAAIESVR